jgi:hypothetical protein
LQHGDLNHRTIAPGVSAQAGTGVKPTGVLNEHFRRGWVNWLRLSHRKHSNARHKDQQQTDEHDEP